MDQFVNEIVALYEQSISNGSGTTRNQLLKHHVSLKEECLTGLQNYLQSSNVNSKESQILQLKVDGQLNAAFDKFLNTRRPPRPKTVSLPARVSSDPHDIAALPEAQHLSFRVVPESYLSDNTNTKHESNEKFTQVPGTSIYYDDSKILSCNNSAIVYEGFFRDSTNQIIRERKAAVKRYLKKSFELFENELQIWMTIDNPENSKGIHVAKLLGRSNKSDLYILAVEWAEMDLGQKIKNIKSQSQNTENVKDKLLMYVKQSVKGLAWLHSKDVIHRDIKPSNILVFPCSDNTTEVVKLTDFGISRRIDVTGSPTQAAGSNDWLAPEVLEAKKSSQKIQSAKHHDIFSLGLTTHFILSLGEHPFAKSKKHGIMVEWNILDPNVNPAKLPYPKYTANHLIQNMLDKIPENRPIVDQVLKHPLLWKPETLLDFLNDFITKLYEKENEKVPEIRDLVDKEYKIWYTKITLAENPTEKSYEFNWRCKVGEQMWEAFKSRRSNISDNNQQKKGKKAKNYQKDSVISLLELIRDKKVHSEDLTKELLNDEHFGVDGIFNKVKFISYFLENFPDLITFIVNLLPKLQEEFPPLKQLNAYYAK